MTRQRPQLLYRSSVRTPTDERISTVHMPAPPRIVPHKTPAGELAVWLLARGAMRGMFARVRLSAPDGDPHAAGVPLLGLANHPSWWDGYLALAIARRYGLRRFLMMDEPQLRRYRFFAWAGCFSVDRTDPREAARSIGYAAQLLATERQPLLWLFPQAEITPADARPIRAHGGAAHILRRAAVTRSVGFLPVAWQYEFRGEQHPEAFIRLGPATIVDAAMARDTAAMTLRIEDALTRQADTLRNEIAANDLRRYQTIVRGKGGVNDTWDRLLRRPRLVEEP